MHLLELHPHFKKARQLMQVLTEREQLSRTDLTELQLEKVNRVWRHAITHVPYYRRLFSEHNLPKEFHDLEGYVSSVPILDKETIRSGTVLSEKPNPGRWYHTGGSTGIPMAIYREREADLEMLSAQYRFRSLWGGDIFDRTVLLAGAFGHVVPSFSAWTASLGASIVDALRNRIRLSPYRLGSEDVRQYLSKMKDFKPSVFYGNSSAIYVLSVEALKAGITIDSLRLIILTGEVVTHTTQNTTERAFPSANVVQEYGAIESLVIAYEDKQRVLRAREDITLVETIPTEENHYQIIVSVLNNTSFPLLRYDIGDLTEGPITQTGFGFATVGAIIGRCNDLLVAKSGRRVRPPISTLSAYMSEHLPSVKRFRAHQFMDGRVLVHLEVDPRTETHDTAQLQTWLAAILEGQPVEIRLVQLIPPIPSGKHTWLTSELAHSNTMSETQKNDSH